MFGGLTQRYHTEYSYYHLLEKLCHQYGITTPSENLEKHNLTALEIDCLASRFPTPAATESELSSSGSSKENPIDMSTLDTDDEDDGGSTAGGTNARMTIDNIENELIELTENKPNVTPARNGTRARTFSMTQDVELDPVQITNDEEEDRVADPRRPAMIPSKGDKDGSVAKKPSMLGPKVNSACGSHVSVTPLLTHTD